MKNSNKKGGAAVVALLIVIILVAVGSAALIVTGRNSIQESKAFASVSTQSSSQADSEVIPESSSVAEVIKDLHPVKSADYKDISVKDSTFNSAIMVNAATNEILAGKDYDKKIYPASLTKIMTILVAAENITDLKSTYKFTADDLKIIEDEDASAAGFAEGESVTAQDLFYGAILPSGADGVIGLANMVAGSQEKFVEIMNEKAVSLGLTNTHFTNAIGLHDKNLYTTVNDLTVILKAAYDNETCRKVLTTMSYTTEKTKQNKDGIELSCVFANRTAGYYIDKNGNGEDDDSDTALVGGKTGFTNEAGCTLASICEDGKNVYFCITTKSQTADASVLEQVSIYEKYLPGSKAEVPDSVVEKDDDSKKTDDTSTSDDTSKTDDTAE